MPCHVTPHVEPGGRIWLLVGRAPWIFARALAFARGGGAGASDEGGGCVERSAVRRARGVVLFPKLVKSKVYERLTKL